MEFQFDHDLHIHSVCSQCAKDPNQTPERILEHACQKRLKTVCVTDHFWDESIPGASEWYERQSYHHISKYLPLPKGENVRFLFGCEAEQMISGELSIAKEHYDRFDFIIAATTHFHRVGLTVTEQMAQTPLTRAKAWVDRLEAVLNADLPFHKMGIAHLTCKLIAPTRELLLQTLDAIPNTELFGLFRKAAELGIGIELNGGALKCTPEEEDIILRPYRIAKHCGCKFYCGSDAHQLTETEPGYAAIRQAITMLGLEETDKMPFLSGKV